MLVILGGRLTAWEAGAVLGNANPLPLESPALDVWDVLLIVCRCGEQFIRIVSTNQKSLLILELLLGLLLFPGQGVTQGANTGAWGFLSLVFCGTGGCC